MAINQKDKLNVEVESNLKQVDNDLASLIKQVPKLEKELASISKAMDNIKNASGGATSSANKGFRELSNSLKSLSRDLKAIEMVSAGPGALFNKAFFGGISTNQKFGSANALDAQIGKLRLAQNEVLRLNTLLRDLKAPNLNFSNLTLGGLKQAEKQLKDFYKYATPQGQANLIKELEKYKNKAWGIQPAKAEPALSQKQILRNTLEQYGVTEAQEKTVSTYNRLNGILGITQLKLMANYAAINAVTGGFRYLLNYTVQYDKELHQLQAIAAVSDTTLKEMKNTIDTVASSTKFTSLEISQAATVLAQAGLSAKQIQGTLPAIANLATATGTDLATSTDVVTSALNVYNLQTSEAEHLTNALTTAMNESKADISGFQTALQYAGNTAAQLGLTYEETAAAIAAATQAGIRSKSMLGTGLRAVLTEFLKPTKKLQDQLAKVGLTIDDIDVKSKGFVNVLKTLREAGFGVEEAYKGMERRGASFLVSLINQTDFMDDLRMKMASSTAAMVANETQMKSLSNQWANFVSIMGTASEGGLAPFVHLLSRLLALTNSFLSTTAGKGITAIVFGTVGTLGVATASVALLGSLGRIVANVKELYDVARKLKNVKDTTTFLGSLLGWLKGGPVLAAVAGVSALVSAVYMLGDSFGWWESKADKAIASMEKQKGKVEEAKESYEGVQSLLQRVYDSRERLQSQTERDIFWQEILTKYPEAIKIIDKVNLSYQELIDTLKELNSLKLRGQANEARALLEATVQNGAGAVSSAARSMFGNPVFFTGSNERAFRESYNQLASTGILGRYRRDPNTIMASTSSYDRIGADILQDLRNSVKDLEAEGKDVISHLSVAATQLKDNEGALRIVNQVLQEEIAERDASTKELQAAMTEFGEDLGTGNFSELQNSIDLYEKTLRDGNQKEDNLIAVYEEVKQTLEEMKPIYDRNTQALKDYSKYTREEAAKRLGISTEQFDNLWNNLRNNSAFKGKTDEELMKSILDNAQMVNSERWNTLQRLFETANNLLARTALGKNYLDSFAAETFWNKGYKAMDKITSGSAKNAKEQARKSSENFSTATIASLNNITGMTGKFGDLQFLTKKGNSYEVNQGAIDTAMSRIRAGFEAGSLGQTNALSQATSAFSHLKEATAGLNEQLTKIPVEKIDTAALKMTEFFNDIEAGIKKIEIAYTRNETGLNLALASQQGIVTGMERAYGSGSVIAEAESIRLKNLQKSQLGARTSNLRTSLDSYVELLGVLKSDSRYANARENYQVAKGDYERIKNSGDSVAIKSAFEKMNRMSDTYRRFTSQEEKLTSKISDLSEKIAENTAALNNETPLTGWEGVRQGLGSAATKYSNSTEEMGLGTVTGSVGYFGSEAINALDTNFNTLFSDILSGSKRAGDAFKDFGKQVIQTLRDIAIQMMVKQGLTMLVSSLFGGFQPGSNVSGTTAVAGGRTNFVGVGNTSGATITASAAMPHAIGGLVNGPVKNRDSVPTMLMPGEYVLRKSAVDTIGRDYLDGLNNNASAMLNASAESISASRDTGSTSSGENTGGVVNVYVVGQEQQKEMTPNDVLVVISQDMLQGGQTKQLVKSIAMGRL